MTPPDTSAIGTPGDAVAAGAISSTSLVADFAVSTRICGYLYAAGRTRARRPQYTRPTTIVVKPLNTDGDGVPNDVDACPSVAGTGPTAARPPSRR